jgi:hypothetical protein
MELFVHAEDCDRLLWECRLWAGDKPLDTVTIGGDSKVWRLDKEDGLIALIMAKVESVWPYHNKITLGKCTVKGDPEAARYISMHLIRLLEERTNECMVDEYEPPDPQDLALQQWIDEQNRLKVEENNRLKAQWQEEERIDEEQKRKELIERILLLDGRHKHFEKYRDVMRQIKGEQVVPRSLAIEDI